MFKFIRKIFGGKKVEPTVVKTMAPPPPVPPNFNPKYRTSYHKPVESIRQSDDDGFLTSMIVAEVTDSTLLGVAIGGNIAGAIVGDMLNDSDDSNSWDNNDSYDSSSSYDDSSSLND